MTLSELYYSKPRHTDKGGAHDYINSYYEYEFGDKKHKPINFLEIGVCWGGSIEVWLEWFTNINLYGIDIVNQLKLDCKDAKIIIEDAYSEKTASTFENNFFDYIIEDGLHTVEYQTIAIKLWLSKLKKGGKLIIEDISSLESVSILEKTAKDICDVSVKVFDLRENKKRYDDIIFEITKNV